MTENDQVWQQINFQNDTLLNHVNDNLRIMQNLQIDKQFKKDFSTKYLKLFAVAVEANIADLMDHRSQIRRCLQILWPLMKLKAIQTNKVLYQRQRTRTLWQSLRTCNNLFTKTALHMAGICDTFLLYFMRIRDALQQVALHPNIAKASFKKDFAKLDKALSDCADYSQRYSYFMDQAQRQVEVYIEEVKAIVVHNKKVTKLYTQLQSAKNELRERKNAEARQLYLQAIDDCIEYHENIGVGQKGIRFSLLALELITEPFYNLENATEFHEKLFSFHESMKDKCVSPSAQFVDEMKSSVLFFDHVVRHFVEGKRILKFEKVEDVEALGQAILKTDADYNNNFNVGGDDNKGDESD